MSKNIQDIDKMFYIDLRCQILLGDLQRFIFSANKTKYKQKSSETSALNLIENLKD